MKKIITALSRVFPRPPVPYRLLKDFHFDGANRWRAAYPKTKSSYINPPSFGGRSVDFGDRLIPHFPELGVLEICNGYVLFPHGWIFTSNGFLLPEFSWHGKDIFQMEIKKPLPKAIKKEGRVLSLLSDWADINYGHFLLDSLSRYHLFLKAGLMIDDVDWVLCPGRKTPRREELLKRLGIPSYKCVWTEEEGALEADVLFVPSFPGVRRNYPPWIAEFIRGALGSKSSLKNRRLYISRSKVTRKVKNEKELEPILRKYHFEIYYAEDNSNPADDFSQAQIVVGAHGAGLTDIVFCAPGTKILELMPSDHVFPYYYTLAEGAGLKYFCLMGESEVVRDKKAWGPSPSDFTIDPQEFESALKQLGT